MANSAHSSFLKKCRDALKYAGYPNLDKLNDEDLECAFLSSGNERLKLLQWIIKHIGGPNIIKEDTEDIKNELAELYYCFGFIDEKIKSKFISGKLKKDAHYDAWEIILSSLRYSGGSDITPREDGILNSLLEELINDEGLKDSLSKKVKLTVNSNNNFNKRTLKCSTKNLELCPRQLMFPEFNEMSDETKEEIKNIPIYCSDFNQIYDKHIAQWLTKEKLNPASRQLGNVIHDLYLQFNEYKKVLKDASTAAKQLDELAKINISDGLVEQENLDEFVNSLKLLVVTNNTTIDSSEKEILKNDV